MTDVVDEDRLAERLHVSLLKSEGIFSHADPAVVEWESLRAGAKCPRCGKERTAAGHDPCIANLPGVIAACCGHGYGYPYIFFENGTIMRMNNVTVDGFRYEGKTDDRF